MNESGNFTALVLDKGDAGVTSEIRQLAEADLPEGEVTVAVSHSTLNYKDGLILKGLGGLVRNYPHVPGIDFAGTVERSDSPDFVPGDSVILTGWRVGETRWGGYAEKARVPAEFLVKCPDGLSAAEAMGIGTAGLCAMMAIMELEAGGVVPSDGEVLVTGAAGGVGGIATAVLSQLGYKVAASTGREALEGYLKDLGAEEVIPRAALASLPERPLLAARWAGAVDAVGGPTLDHLLAEMDYRGVVAACGLAGGSEMAGTVIPFLLRGVRLIGIDTVMCPAPIRQQAWMRLARDMPRDKLAAAMHSVALADLPKLADEILAGKVQGRTVVEING